MAHPALYTISGIITFAAILLILIYSLNKKFRSYPFYFNIMFTISITFDNVIRLIPAGRGTGIDIDKEKTIPCKIQAFSLTFFDKFMLTLMVVYSIISYLGIFKMEFYKNFQKLIFITLTCISITISFICTMVFYYQGISDRSEFCYVETKNNVKKVVDSIVTSILLLINLFCIIRILIKIYQLKKENDKNNIKDRKNSFNHHLIRFIFDFFINFITFIYVILLILKLLPFDSFVKDLIYIILSLIVELYFTVNTELLKEIKRIITCSKIDDDNTRLDSNDFNESFNDDNDNDNE